MRLLLFWQYLPLEHFLDWGDFLVGQFLIWIFSTAFSVLQLTWPGTDVTFWQILLGSIVFSGLMTICVGWAVRRRDESKGFDQDGPIPINRRLR